jgi:parallel beta helix pectate lyase-like protein
MPVVRAFLPIVICLLFCAAAEAQLQRTFVASAGNDANPCSRTAPCRNFSAAIAAVADGGEVVALDSAGYGTMVIGKSVSIIAPAGVYAGVTGFSGDAVQLIQSTATVVLRGLTINGLGGSNGIDGLAAHAVQIESCVVTGFPGTAVQLTSPGQVAVVDTIVRNNGYGIFVAPLPGAATGVVDHCRAENNGTGFGIGASGLNGGTITLTVRDSVATDGFMGIAATFGAAVYAESCAATNNTYGVYSSNGATVGISRCLVSGNLNAFSNSATMYSFGNNAMIGNSQSVGSLTSIATQ